MTSVVAAARLTERLSAMSGTEHGTHKRLQDGLEKEGLGNKLPATLGLH